MPIYEYRCDQCETKFEALQSVGADGSDLECPNCGASAPAKLISAFASLAAENKSCSSRSGFT